MADTAETLFEQLLAEQSNRNLPPVETWQPEREGEIDIRIGADGVWYHEGSVINRQAIVDLFATILRREDEQYFLVTPAEKLAIQVDDVPFFVTGFERSGTGKSQRLLFSTRTGDRVIADSEHPLSVDSAETDPAPYLMIRHNMWGRLSRNVFYQLVDIAEPGPEDPGTIGVYSDNCWFELGRTE